MDVVAGNIPADDLRDQIQSAQSNLALAADADVLRRDPYRCELARNNDPLRGVFRVQSRPL